jgi:hypothetical protein
MLSKVLNQHYDLFIWFHVMYHYELHKFSSINCPQARCKFKSKFASSYFALYILILLLNCLITT